MAEDENNKKDTSYKVVLIGESGVGKTCILAQFVNNEFDPETITSDTSQVIHKKLDLADGKKITFYFWDTAGQEKYRSLARLFFKDADVVVLVYDITFKGSFELMKSYWYKQVIDHGKKNVLFAVAANKVDLYEERQVTDDEGEEFAKEIGAIFVSTSAKNDVGVTQLFDSIGQRILNKNNFDYFSKEKNDKIKDKNINEENIINEKINIEKIQEEKNKEENIKREIVKKDDDDNENNIEKSKSFVMTIKTHRESIKKKSWCCLFN